MNKKLIILAFLAGFILISSSSYAVNLKLNPKTATLCDLHIYNPDIFPDKFREGDEVSVTFNLRDEKHNYEGQIEIELVSEEIGLNRHIYPEFIEEGLYELKFNWPNGYTDKYVLTLTIYPKPLDEWIDVDWSDNTYQFNIGPSPVFRLSNLESIFNPIIKNFFNLFT